MSVRSVLRKEYFKNRQADTHSNWNTLIGSSCIVSPLQEVKILNSFSKNESPVEGKTCRLT